LSGLRLKSGATPGALVYQQGLRGAAFNDLAVVVRP
jgi:hypothetical protein